MSIKRTKQRTDKRHAGSSGSFQGFGGAGGKPEQEKTWEEHMQDKPEEAFQAYALTKRFAKGTLLNHAVFGKGIVLAAEERKIEVLFAEGRKNLAHAPG